MFSALRVGLAILLVVGTGLAALHLWHRQRLELGSMLRELDAAASHSLRLAAAAERKSPEATLSELAGGPHATPGTRLLEMLGSASVEPPAAATPPPPDRQLGFEFDGDDPYPMRPVDLSPEPTDEGIALDMREGGYLVSATGFEAGGEPLAEIAIRIRLREGSAFTLGWTRRPLGHWPDDPDLVDRFEVDVVRDGAFHVYRVDATQAMRLEPGKRIRTLFLAPSNVPGDRVEIDWIRVIPKRARYAAPAVGLTQETLDRDTRPALYAAAPREMVFPVSVPRESPRLDLGLGILDANRPVRFEVEAVAGSQRVPLLERRVADPERWRDERVDLAALAGRDVKLHLRFHGEPGAVGLVAAPRISGAPSRRLNVLFVVEDTLRADHLSAWGYARPTSPTKDRLARDGVVFEQAFSQATKTRPSVPSYLTGLHPSTTGVWSFHDRLDPAFVTLAEVLRGQGFETASFVQNTNAGAAAGLAQGFDRVIGQKRMGLRPQSVYSGEPLAWIRERRDRNWFAYLHVLDPHGAYDPPPPFDAWYREDPGGEPVERDPRLDPPYVETPTREGRQRLYDGEILHNDSEFEKLLKALQELGIGSDTLIVFLSDHGEHMGEHGLWEHHPPGFTPVLHVPLLLWQPDRLPSGRRIAQPVGLVDVVPTVLELAGVDASGLPLQGRSLLRHLEAGRPLPGLVVSEEAISYSRDRPERVRGSIYVGPWHYLYSRIDGKRGLRVFDRADDPGETRPALPGLGLDPWLERSVVSQLRTWKRANLALGAAIARPAGEEVELDPEAREQLRALGYID